MTSVISRTFRSSPHRDSAQTWSAIVELLTRGKQCPARTELLAVAGIASSLIADRAPDQAPMVVTCDGPRTRIYCLYDDAALEDDGDDEGVFGFDPLQGDWHVSLPCFIEDLAWVQAALKRESSRITARDKSTGLSTDDASGATTAASMSLNFEEFLKS